MLVTFNQAKELKELGYNDKCVHYYLEGLQDHYLPHSNKYILKGAVNVEIGNRYDNWNHGIYSDNKYAILFSAPSVSSALQWIRENKGILCYVDIRFNPIAQKAMYLGKLLSESGLLIQKKTIEFDNYPSAESALLTAILEYLKEKK